MNDGATRKHNVFSKMPKIAKSLFRIYLTEIILTTHQNKRLVSAFQQLQVIADGKENNPTIL